jgi:hypothetical protein
MKEIERNIGFENDTFKIGQFDNQLKKKGRRFLTPAMYFKIIQINQLYLRQRTMQPPILKLEPRNTLPLL